MVISLDLTYETTRPEFKVLLNRLVHRVSFDLRPIRRLDSFTVLLIDPLQDVASIRLCLCLHPGKVEFV